MNVFDIKNHKDDLIFLPLGGAGEIGMNLNLYYHKDTWLMIDLGIGFADRLPGIDIITPDITYIERHKSKLIGLVLTHAHEDHLGAVQYLWQELGCPVYATKFTANVLRAKLRDEGNIDQVKIIEIEENSEFDLGPFSIKLINITHSIPEMSAMLIKTDKGSVFHTGDWKLDHDPVIGHPTNEQALKDIGDSGVLAMVCDSTNVFNYGTSGSEGDLKENLERVIAGAHGDKLIVVATFASNVARLHSIAMAADACNRRVVLAGRSLWRIYLAAQESGYLKDIKPFLKDKEMAGFKRSEVLVIATGCQGEPLAALNKMASGSHPCIKLHPRDMVIFSSKIIPGNDKKIYELFNKLSRMDVDVMTERDHFVHVSGHPSRDELTKMYELIRPQIAIPVHGEFIHMHEQYKLAKECGVKQAVRVSNGDAIKLSKEGPEHVGRVESGYLAIDGNYIIPVDSHVIRERLHMQKEGVVFASILLKSNGSLLKQPLVFTPGVLDQKNDSDVLDNIIERILDVLEVKHKLHKEEMEKALITAIKQVVKAETGKQPRVFVQLEKLKV